MKLFNYAKLFGAFINASQLIELDVEPKDRQERKMLEEANKLVDASWARREAFMADKAAKAGEDLNAEELAKEKEAFFPKVENGKVFMPLQFIQDFMVKKMAAIQNNTSIHNTKEVAELKEVFDLYGVQLHPKFTGLVFDHISWSARERQKPKLMLHTKQGDDVVVIRFEAASELCQKFLNVVLALKLKPGTVFDLQVEAVDPAIERNKKAGRKVAELGLYVNHNLTVTVGTQVHTGHPPKGTRFVQKPTIEQLEALFYQARDASAEDPDI